MRRIKSGFYSDKYFVRTRETLLKDGNNARVMMQVFAKEKAVLCGIDEAIAILKTCSGGPLKIRALYDGDRIEPWETVMTVEGRYSDFAHLETLYLGVMARGTSVATVAADCVEAAGGRDVLFFAPRFDHYSVQESDGYAALVGGASTVTTDACGTRAGIGGTGTMPHGLIAAYGGNTLEAAGAFDRCIKADVRRIVLVDFDNDCVRESLRAAGALGDKLWGVRLDTAENMRDESVKGRNSYGVCPELVRNVRRELDRHGFKHVRIVMSGGFDPEKIRDFVRRRVPFDAVGVGSRFYRHRIDFTADVVKVNAKPCSKAGRTYRKNPLLRPVLRGELR